MNKAFRCGCVQEGEEGGSATSSSTEDEPEETGDEMLDYDDLVEGTQNVISQVHVETHIRVYLYRASIVRHSFCQCISIEACGSCGWVY